MLLKLIDTTSFYPQDEKLVSVIDPTDVKKGLVKQAMDSRVQEFASRITPSSGKTYLHIVAMGAGEYWGANRNADFFPESNLIDYHNTFETSPAHIFKNHVNKNPEIAIGRVIFSVYNERMHRVELIAELWNDKAPDVVQRIEDGDWPKTSMATKTPFDVCSVCSNKARTREEYCEHLTEELGRVYPDGRKVMALNIAPLRFFDISIVFRPADVTSSVLQKVASASEPVQSSVDAAIEAGLQDLTLQKSATLKKLSELIKEIEGDVVSADPSFDNLVSRVSDPKGEVIDILRNYKLNEIFSTFGHLGISPSVGFLAELIARKIMGEEGRGLGPITAAYIDQVGSDGMLDFDRDFGEITEPNLGVTHALIPYLGDSSYLPDYVEQRVALNKQASTFGYVQGTNVGFAGNGPKIEPTVYEKFREQNLKPEADNKSGLMKVLNTIVAIGGAAIAAKWYITQVIERKMKEQDLNRASDGVKIVLVKSASDYKLTYKLAKTAMLKLVQKKKI
jgi:hypothetical protein